MAELNSTDHLVRLDKDTLANGYDNEAYHPHTDDGDEPPASEDERLRATTENGHCVDATPLSNGHAAANATPLNGTVVVDVDDANMDVNIKSNKPLDTRLHHYVPVEDVDRKILNGSDVSARVSADVRARKSVSRESIAMEDFRPPSYDGDDAKSEKAELEAELSNHNNGVSAYGESHFISEKLNGKSAKSVGDESGKLPVNNHRKCLSRESSISSRSKRRHTGEKLYFTEENRKLCPHFKRSVWCGVIVVVISVVLLVCVLAATGIILSKSENTRYESGHSLPSMDSISHAGHSFRPRPPPNVPHQFLNTTPTVTSRVPLAPNDSSHVQSIVPNALVGEFTIIDENFTDDLNDNSSRGYINLARNLETELRRIFRENGGKFDTLKILNFRPGSIKVKFVVIWSPGEDVILSDRATEILAADLKQKNNSFYNFFPVDIDSIHFINVFDECRTQKGGCSFDCVWNYDTLSKTCVCPQKMYLLPDGKSCSLIPETSSTSTTTTTAVPSILEPALSTFPAEETTLPEIQNFTIGNESSFVALTEELITTQPSIDETTTILNKEVTDFVSTLFAEDQTSPETTTAQPLSEATNQPFTTFPSTTTETIKETGYEPLFLETTTEQTAHTVTTENLETITFNAETTDKPFVISTSSAMETVKETGTEPLFEETATEQTVHTVTSENPETTFNAEATGKPFTTLPSSTVEVIKETVTEPLFLETTTDGTSSKFPIVEPTTEVYTFNTNFDYTTENVDTTVALDTLPTKGDATEFTELPVETIYTAAFNENITMQPDMQPHAVNQTEIEPVTTLNPPWTYSEVNREGTLKEDQTEFTTLNVNTMTDQTRPIIPSGAMGYETTFSTLEISEADHPTVPPILNKNETEEFTTENQEVLPTTSSSIPLSNRTSGMRYIDNFTDLYENITDNRNFNMEDISTDAVTEQIDHVSEFPLNMDNSSLSDATTHYPKTETTYYDNDFTGTAVETKPTGEPSIWIKKVDKVNDYTTQNNNLSAIETAMETETIFMNVTTFEIENTTVLFEISTDGGYSTDGGLEDEVHLQHGNDTLTLPTFSEESETAVTGLNIETTTNVFPTVIESLVTIPQTVPQNNTEELGIGTTLLSTESMFFTNTEPTTLLHDDEVNTNTQETTNRGNYSEIFPTSDSYPPNGTTEINTFESGTVTFPDLQNNTDNPFIMESNLTDTTLSDLGTTFTLNDTEISNISSGIELNNSTQTTLQDTTLPIETTDTDISPMETLNATVILDAETSTNYPEESMLFTNRSDGMVDVTTDAILYTDSTNLNESTDTSIGDNYTQTVPPTLVVTDSSSNTNISSNLDTEFPIMNGTEIYETTLSFETESPVELTNETDSSTNQEMNETITYTESPFLLNFTEEVTTIQAETSLDYGSVLEETSTTPYMETTTTMPISSETESLLTNDMNTTEVNTLMFNGTDTFLNTEEGTTFAPYLTEGATFAPYSTEGTTFASHLTEGTTFASHLTENTTIIEEKNITEVHYNWRNVANKQDENLTRDFGVLPDHFNSTDGNYSLVEDYGNYTSTGFEGLLNETTTNASVGIVCREDQFICEPLNTCLNYTFMCDGIQDCPDGIDEFSCQDSCGSNFRCSNSSNMCIMSQAHCDGIWDCENGTDEDNCTPTECAKHEVMCLDHSKCIRPSDICDLKYDCKDRSDEVGCVERTTCESGGRFFCNDGLCIPWSLKCDGEYDCKDKEDEGNCTCLNDEFQCNDGKCLKSSSRCDGHKDCHDADDEMGCVNVDSQHIVTTYEPYSGTWALLCAEDFNLDDGHYLCQELGFGHALKTENLHVSFNGTWMAMRRENLTDASLWTERVSFVESCTSSAAAVVECQKFACGEYSGLLHRRKRDVLSSSSSSSTQWPFIGYTSTFNSNRGCMSEILTPIWLITSAECLLSINKEPYNGSDWYVRTNIGRSGDASLAQNHEVLRIVSHSHSSKFRSLILRDYDVALVRLKHALVFVSDKIGAICPPEEQVPAGITCFSGVLGTQKPRAPPPTELTINSLALQIMERKNCNSVEHYNNQINQRMLCTQSSEGHTICDNDEGTPLMCLTGINKWFLAGMLTYQRYCEVYSKHPAVFSNIYAMRKFIDQVTGQKQYETSYDPNVYLIIPPTTPSPTVPETTTYIYTTTEALTTDLTTDFNYTVTGMFNESETDTTQAIEMSLSPMLQDSNVTEPFGGRMEEETTLGTVELGGGELLTTAQSAYFTMESNATSEGLMDSNSTSEDSTEYPNWNVTSNVTNVYDVLDNFTTVQPFTLLPNVNATMMDDNSTLQEDFGFENVSYSSPDMYERGLFNASGMPNKTHDSMMVGLTTETYPGYDNATEFDINLLNGTEQAIADTEVTTVTLLEGTDNPFMHENATDLNSTIDNVHVPSMSNETSFKAPERLTLTTLHPEFDGETTPSLTEMNSTEINTTDFLLINETIAMDYNLTGIDGSELTTETTNTAMKAARFESETIGYTEPSILINGTETLNLMNATTEAEMQATEPTQHPFALTDSESVLENMTTQSDAVTERTPEAEFKEEKMRFIEHPYLDNETATMYPDSENTTEPIADLNMTTNTAAVIELETTGYTADILTETTPNLELMFTTMMPEIETLAFEAEVDTDKDLSITLNGSDGNVVEHVASLDAFGTFQNNNSATEYLARSRMLDDTSNSSGILFDSGLLNTSYFNETNNSTLAEGMVLVDNGNSSGILSGLEYLNDSFHYIGLNNSLGIISENVSSSDVLGNFEENYNSTFFNIRMVDDASDSPNNSTMERSRMLEDGGNSSRIIYDWEVSNNSFNNTTYNVTKFNNVPESENVTLPTELMNTTLWYEMNFSNDTAQNVSSITPLIEYEGSMLNETTLTHLLHVATDELTIYGSDFCGIWVHSSNASDAIQKPFFAEWPSLGYLKLRGNSQRCASTLISANFLITSLQCLSSRDSEINADKWAYIGGVYNRDPSIVGEQNHLLKEIIRYPNSSLPEFFNNTDLALVKLMNSVNIDDYSMDICLPKHTNATFQECYTTGWKNGSSDNPEFFSIPVDIISPELCNHTNNYSRLLSNNFICATSKASLPTCEMDPGAPLYCLNSNQKWEIQGILTIPNPCDMKEPALFNSISSTVQWISQTLYDAEN